MEAVCACRCYCTANERINVWHILANIETYCTRCNTSCCEMEQSNTRIDYKADLCFITIHTVMVQYVVCNFSLLYTRPFHYLHSPKQSLLSMHLNYQSSQFSYLFSILYIFFNVGFQVLVITSLQWLTRYQPLNWL